MPTHYAAYDEDIANDLLHVIATTHFSMTKACAEIGWKDVRSVYGWLNNNEEFAQRYARARDKQADVLADEIVDIADEDPGEILGARAAADGIEFDVVRVDGAAVQHQRLRIDARKWVASKLKPKKYGDRIENTVVGDPDRPVCGKILIEGVSVGNNPKNTDP